MNKRLVFNNNSEICKEIKLNELIQIPIGVRFPIIFG